MGNDRFPVNESLVSEGLSPADFTTLLASRRSIRRLQDGPFSTETQQRIEDAIRYTPSAYNLPSFHVLFVHAERDAFWNEVAAGFRERLDGDRLERYLQRVEGFRNGTAVIAIYEDRHVHPQLRDAWNLTDAQALEFSQQSLGMLQFSIWLALTAEGLVTSLQHWDWLLKDRLETFFELPEGRFHLTAIMPIGYPAEPPRENQPIAIDRLLSRDRYNGT